jgi:parallel beta-helix repeat protein
VFHPYIFPKSCRTSLPSDKVVASYYQPYLFSKAVRLLSSYSSVLFFTTIVGLASTLSVTTNVDSALAQKPIALEQGQVDVKTMSQVNVLFVNPSIGNDNIGNSSERTPLKTITKALQSASPNTVIILSKGTYSAETGERFPLMLKPGISLQGDQRSKGHDVVIRGGGDYLSRTFGSQNVAIIGADRSKLTGVTVTNSSRRGYGLWIESSSPVVVENTFAGNTQDGIAVTGNSQPLIRHNDFYQNRANGITMSGNSRPEVRENVFQQTGFGINIAQNAQPRVVGNRIQDNRCGIVVQANARPIVRNNLIQNNQEDGLVAINQAIPDLGTPSEPGGNEFRGNHRYDINASTAKQLIVAYGNNLNSDHVIGKINTNSTNANERVAEGVPNNSILHNNSSYRTNSSKVQPQSVKLSVSVAAPTMTNVPAPINLTGYGNPPLRTQHINRQQVVSTPRLTNPLINSRNPYRQVSPQMPTNKPDTPQLNYVQISPNTIEFSAPQSRVNPVASAPVQPIGTPDQQLPVASAPVQPISTSNQQLPVVPAPVQSVSTQGQQLPVESAPVQPVSAQWQQLPVVEAAPVSDSSVSPVPSSNIRKGNTHHVRKASAHKAASVSHGRGLSQKVSSVGQIDLRYRVVVEAGTQQDEQLVKFLAPNAFHTVWHGQEVMQVGVFSNRYNADNMVKILNNKGLKAVVEPIN